MLRNWPQVVSQAIFVVGVLALALVAVSKVNENFALQATSTLVGEAPLEAGLP